MRAVRTNPAYAELAYKRTIIHQTIVYLRREFVGLDEEPKQEMICEDVLASDAVVPIESIAQFVEDLEEEEHNLTLELNKFQFTRQDNAKATQNPKHTKQKKNGKSRR